MTQMKDQTTTTRPVLSRMNIAQMFETLLASPAPVRFTAYDGSAYGPEDAAFGLDLKTERGLAYLVTAPGDLGLARAYVSGDLDVRGVHPGDPYQGMLTLLRSMRFRRPSAAEALALMRSIGVTKLVPPPPPPQEHLPRWRRAMEGLRHSPARDGRVISHHYDVSNRFYEMVLGPSMTYTCALFPTEDATLEEAQHAKYDLVARKLDLRQGQRLLDVGCGWGGMVRHAAREYGVRAIGVTLSKQQAEWAQAKIKEDGLDHLAEVRHLDYRSTPETGFDAISSIGLTEHIGVDNYPAYFRFLRDKLLPHGRLLNHCITRPDNRATQTGAFIDRYVFPDGELTRIGQDHHRDPGRRPRGAPRGEPADPLRQDARRLVREPRGQLGRVRGRGRRGHGPRLGPLHGRLPDGLRAQRDPAPPGARDEDRRRRSQRLPAAPHVLSNPGAI